MDTIGAYQTEGSAKLVQVDVRHAVHLELAKLALQIIMSSKATASAALLTVMNALMDPPAHLALLEFWFQIYAFCAQIPLMEGH